MDRTGARRYWPIWAVATPLALWTLIRAFGLEVGFPLVPLMAFTPYAAIAALLFAGVAVAFRNWAAAVLLTAATVCLSAAVLPRAIGSGAVDAAGHRTLSVLSANLYYSRADPVALVDLIDRYRPDLLSVQELNARFAVKLRQAGVAKRLPYSIVPLGRSAYATGLYSRFPLTPLPQRKRFFPRLPHVAISLPGGRRLRVVGIHPPTPLAGKVDAWQAALESLPSAGTGVPWILVGDFNATLDQAELRGVLDRGYRDAGDVTGKGLEPTWPTRDHMLPPTITIDHVLADHRIGIADYGVVELPGSDHRAIHALLALP